MCFFGLKEREKEDWDQGEDAEVAATNYVIFMHLYDVLIMRTLFFKSFFKVRK